jgi:hypothetical protein
LERKWHDAEADVSLHRQPNRDRCPVEGDRECSRRRACEKILVRSRRAHSGVALEPELLEALRRRDFDTQADRVDADIRQGEERASQVATDERPSMSWARVKPSEVGVEQLHWHTSAAEVGRPAGVGRVKPPGLQPTRPVAPPRREKVMLVL